MNDNIVSLGNRPDFGSHPCPACGHDAPVIGGFNAIDYIQCYRCGYEGDHFEDDDGVVYDIPVLAPGDRDPEVYARRVAEIAAAAAARKKDSRHEHRHNERLQKLRELSDEQLQALSDDEFWDAVEPDGICPTCDPRLAAEARRRNAHAPWKH